MFETAAEAIEKHSGNDRVRTASGDILAAWPLTVAIKLRIGRVRDFYGSITEGLARGGLILCLPAVYDRAEVQRLLAYLAPEPGVAWRLDVLSAMAPLVGLAAAVGAAASLTVFVRHRTLIDLARAAERVILVLTFVLLPALLAFAIHFNCLHAAAARRTTSPPVGQPRTLGVGP